MIRFGVVVKVNPGTRRLDLVDMLSGAPLGNCPLLAPDVSDAGGSWNVPSVALPTSLQASGGIPSTGRKLIAAYTMGPGNTPVVLGFVHMQGGQLLFSQGDRQISLHAASGTYTTTAPDGSFETYHGPSGAYFRIGTGPHEPLAPLAPAGGFTAAAAGATQPTVSLVTGTFSLVIAPNGAAVLKALTLEVDAPSTFKGDMMVMGKVTATGDGVFNSVSVGMHEHGNVQNGSGVSGPPIAGS